MPVPIAARLFPPQAWTDNQRAALRPVAVKARWVCEQARRQPKGELSPEHFKEHSGTGLRRHALTICVAFYLQHLCLVGRRRIHPASSAWRV